MSELGEIKIVVDSTLKAVGEIKLGMEEHRKEHIELAEASAERQLAIGILQTDAENAKDNFDDYKISVGKKFRELFSSRKYLYGLVVLGILIPIVLWIIQSQSSSANDSHKPVNKHIERTANGNR